MSEALCNNNNLQNKTVFEMPNSSDTVGFIQAVADFCKKNKLSIIPRDALARSFGELYEIELSISEEGLLSDEECLTSYEQYLAKQERS